MFRMLRYGLLGLVCAVPLAIPQSSEASPIPARAAPARFCHTPRVVHGCYRGHVFHTWHAHRYIHLRHCR